MSKEELLRELRAEHEYLKSTLVPALRSELLDMENSRNEERARGERLRAERCALREENAKLRAKLTPDVVFESEW